MKNVEKNHRVKPRTHKGVLPVKRALDNVVFMEQMTQYCPPSVGQHYCTRRGPQHVARGPTGLTHFRRGQDGYNEHHLHPAGT
jgi:hypothetical protein